ncbi:hypothetical protein ADIS_1016 [Lunatimonas lonarensis]|uniref:Uncharacterized protein n=1 Tax=Lunatimonas lonarensis TaxID=1232681 RepID=R7ZWJ0_9BACT|nr:hypothetical protein ADIS_1016 [Lunatimonas lonarensis]
MQIWEVDVRSNLCRKPLVAFLFFMGSDLWIFLGWFMEKRMLTTNNLF